MGEGKLRTSRKGNKGSCVELRNKSILATNVLVSDGKKKKSPDIVQKNMWGFLSMWVREDNFSIQVFHQLPFPNSTENNVLTFSLQGEFRAIVRQDK